MKELTLNRCGRIQNMSFLSPGLPPCKECILYHWASPPRLQSSYSNILYFKFHMWDTYLFKNQIYLSWIFVPRTLGSLRRTSEPLELWVIVCHHVGAENCCICNKRSQPLGRLSRHRSLILEARSHVSKTDLKLTTQPTLSLNSCLYFPSVSITRTQCHT